MTMSLEAAAQVMRDAMRETVRRYSLWYLIQSALMILAGFLALVYPVVSSVAVVVLLGWLLIISGVVQGISLIGARSVPARQTNSARGNKSAHYRFHCILLPEPSRRKKAAENAASSR